MIPQFAGFTDKANAKACLSDARIILTAYTTLVAENSSITALPVSGTQLTNLTGTLDG